MKIPVAVAGGAPQGGGGAVLAGRHELAAAVDGVLADAGGVVFAALLVGDLAVELGIELPLLGLLVIHFGSGKVLERGSESVDIEIERCDVN